MFHVLLEQKGQRGNKMKVTVTCEHCGKTKEVYANPNQSFKYCSREWYQKARGAVIGGKLVI